MECPEARLLIHGYVDGELDLRAALEVEKHLAGCPPCTQALASHRALTAVLRAAPLEPRAPAHLRARLAESIRREQPPLPAAPWWRSVRLVAPGVAVALLLLCVVPRPPDRLAEDAVASHVRSLLPGHLEDVASTDRHTVKPWFAGKLDYAPPVEDCAPEGFPLEGARLDYLDHRTVAALVYRRRGHLINVFVWPAPGAADAQSQPAALSGYHVARWIQKAMVYWAVSDLNEAELDHFAQLLRNRTIK